MEVISTLNTLLISPFPLESMSPLILCNFCKLHSPLFNLFMAVFSSSYLPFLLHLSHSCAFQSGERWWPCSVPGQPDHSSDPSSGDPWTHHGSVVPAGEFCLCQPHLRQNCAKGRYFTCRRGFKPCFGKNQPIWGVCVEDFEILPTPKGPLWPQAPHGSVCVCHPWILLDIALWD